MEGRCMDEYLKGAKRYSDTNLFGSFVTCQLLILTVKKIEKKKPKTCSHSKIVSMEIATMTYASRLRFLITAKFCF